MIHVSAEFSVATISEERINFERFIINDIRLLIDRLFKLYPQLLTFI